MRDFFVSVLGPWFGWLYDLYDAHALWINIVVIIYGFVIVLSWNNLLGIRRRLVQDLIDQVRRAPAGTADLSLIAATLMWDEAVAASRFPLVARQNALWPRRTSVEAVRALLPVEALMADARKVLGIQADAGASSPT